MSWMLCTTIWKPTLRAWVVKHNYLRSGYVNMALQIEGVWLCKYDGDALNMKDAAI